MTKKITYIVFISTILLYTMFGCTNKYNEDGKFTYSKIQTNFPVPDNAKLIGSDTKNKNIEEIEKYKLKNIGGQQGLIIPKNYIAKIKKNGWTELENERDGSKLVFKKNKQIIWVIFSQDQFYICKIKGTEAT